MKNEKDMSENSSQANQFQGFMGAMGIELPSEVIQGLFKSLGAPTGKAAEFAKEMIADAHKKADAEKAVHVKTSKWIQERMKTTEMTVAAHFTPDGITTRFGDEMEEEIRMFVTGVLHFYQQHELATKLKKDGASNDEVRIRMQSIISVALAAMRHITGTTDKNNAEDCDCEACRARRAGEESV